MFLKKVISEPNFVGGERAVARQYWSRYLEQPVWACGSAVRLLGRWSAKAPVASVSKAGHKGHCEPHYNSPQESKLSKSF